MALRDYWTACEHPERANDPMILWHFDGCAACALKAEATIRQIEAGGPGLPLPTADTERDIRILNAVIARNRP